MPVFEYRCTSCSTVYDIFHRGRELTDDIICPACGSREHKKLISAPSIAVSSGSHAHGSEPPPCSSGGGCCGGACGMD